MDTKNLSIMFTDMKGFTTLSSTQSRAQLQHLLDLQDSLMRPVFKLSNGRVVKTIGDAFMVVFESPTNAVLCGMKIQENILNHNAMAPSSDQFEVRIAVNAGEVTINQEGDVFGEAVNIASRIESISEPNEVYFTESVYLSMNKNEIPTAEVGERHLKGIPQAVKVYKVLQERTTLIMNKMKRAELALEHSNLDKGEIHDVAIKETAVVASNPDNSNSMFKKYKKSVFVILIVLIVIIVFFTVRAAVNKPKEPVEKINNIQNINPPIKSTTLSINEVVAKAKDLTVQKRWPDLIRFLNQAFDGSYQNYTEAEKQRFRELIKNILPQVPANSPPSQALKDLADRLK